MTLRDHTLREVRDAQTGEYIAHHDPHTGEIVRRKRGRELRGKLTEPPRGGDTLIERANPRD